MHSNFTINALTCHILFGFLNAFRHFCAAVKIMGVHLYDPDGTIMVYQCIITLINAALL